MNPRYEKLIQQRRFGCLPSYRDEHRRRRESGEFGQWYKYVPKDREANAAFRKRMLDEAAADPVVAATLREACKQDILFFINTFLFIFEPRDIESGERSLKELLWITYDFQDSFVIDDVLAVTEGASVRNPMDLVLEKSRDMGATWIVLAVLFWYWLFHDYSTFGLVSHIEDAIDIPNKPGTLLWKIDFMLERLPWFLRPDVKRGRDRAKNRIHNPDNRSSMTGYAATEDVATGDRTLGFYLDEFGKFAEGKDGHALASTQAVAPWRLFSSTPKGMGGKFADMAATKSSAVRVATLPWFMHPDKSIGLYTSRKEGQRYVLEIIDQDFDFPEGYEFILDGRLRSYVFDSEWNRRPSERFFAQEWEIDYVASGSMFFDARVLQERIEDCKIPFHRGWLKWDVGYQNIEWVEDRSGPIKLWFRLNPSTKQPPHEGFYAAGIDTASGAGGDQSSNSVSTWGDRRSYEVVADIVCNAISPDDFGELNYVMGHWLCGNEEEAYLAWEENGVGGIMGRKLISLGYRNFHRRKMDKLIVKKLAQKGKVPGWNSTPDSKRHLLKAFGTALTQKLLTERDEQALEECKQFVYNGRDVTHSKAIHAEDPAHEGENHGDRVIARALLWLCFQERGISPEVGKTDSLTVIKAGDTFPVGSFGWRRQQRLREMQPQREMYFRDDGERHFRREMVR